MLSLAEFSQVLSICILIVVSICKKRTSIGMFPLRTFPEMPLSNKIILLGQRVCVCVCVRTWSCVSILSPHPHPTKTLETFTIIQMPDP